MAGIEVYGRLRLSHETLDGWQVLSVLVMAETTISYGAHSTDGCSFNPIPGMASDMSGLIPFHKT